MMVETESVMITAEDPVNLEGEWPSSQKPQEECQPQMPDGEIRRRITGQQYSMEQLGVDQEPWTQVAKSAKN